MSKLHQTQPLLILRRNAKRYSVSQLRVKDSSSRVSAELAELIAVRKEREINHVFVLSLVGRILKDDQTLDEYKITEGLTVHLVKGKTAA